MKGSQILARFLLGFCLEILEICVRTTKSACIKPGLKTFGYLLSFIIPGYAFGAGIVHHLSQRELQEMDDHQKALDEVHRVEEGFENFTGKHGDNPPNMNMYTGLTAL